MSALISGVKNFVSMANSLVRALPFSQVKSANAKGSAFCGRAALACSCDFVTAAATAGLATVAATGAALGAFAEMVVPELVARRRFPPPSPLLDSLRFQFGDALFELLHAIEHPTLALGQRRGDSILEASLFAGADFAADGESLSSASRRFEKMTANSNAAKRICSSFPTCLNARISLS